MLAGRRQSSLDETGGGRRRLRRQASETRAPAPILAWQESLTEQEENQKQVEVVAKKIGQPKPAAPARPLRSPSIRNSESCLTISRRQVAERLRVGWSKANVKEVQGKDKGRQNLNIFLNKSFEVRPASPKTPELGNSGFRRSQSFLEDRQDGQVSISGSTSESDSSSEDDEGEAIEGSRGLPTTNPSPGPRQVGTPTPGFRPGFASPSPGSRPVQPAGSPCPRPATSSPCPRPAQPSPSPGPRPPLSASARRAAFRAVGRQRPTTSSPEPRPRLMSAPPQARPTFSADRPTSAPPRRPRRSAKPRRGVEGGEVVTMVSLVSPAESEDEEVLPVTVQCPPTPEVPPTPEPPVNTPPPPILSLRRPPKAVTFKSCSVDGPEFRTSYPPVRSATILQEDPGKAKEPPHPDQERKPKQQQQQQAAQQQPLQQQQRSVRIQRNRAALQMAAREGRKQSQNKIPEPIQEEVRPETVEKGGVVKGGEEVEDTKKEEEEVGREKEEEGKTEAKDPDLRSAKERECWQLFKRMSSRGVSVSFETVLRGLLTPTEYRLRRSALLASC